MVSPDVKCFVVVVIGCFVCLFVCVCLLEHNQTTDALETSTRFREADSDFNYFNTKSFLESISTVDGFISPSFVENKPQFSKEGSQDQSLGTADSRTTKGTVGEFEFPEASSGGFTEENWKHTYTTTNGAVGEYGESPQLSNRDFSEGNLSEAYTTTNELSVNMANLHSLATEVFQKRTRRILTRRRTELSVNLASLTFPS
jgi:hypothetical protein